jgi:2-isopropylmalate synthase
MQVLLYDTTLRDGTQGEGISLSCDDKLKIAKRLDEFGMHYIEGGWPGSNPKDADFFREVQTRRAKLVAFGSTRRARTRPEDDANLRALLEAETPAVALVGKSWTLHVARVLETSLEENVAMIAESVAFMKARGLEVVYDAEHFFDGYRADPGYAIATLRSAAAAGADWITLCDTNGGSLPSWIGAVIGAVSAELGTPLGIHAHNDSELAVANSLAAVEAGCRLVQGTINGYGERCGNANLVSILPTLRLKMGLECAGRLERLTELSRTLAEIANLSPDAHAPYVGASAFAHKGGIHVAAVEKIAASYEHVAPESVGNRHRVVVSELSGRGNVRVRAAELGLDVSGREREVLEQVKEMEGRGYQFEAAEGSFELLARRGDRNYAAPFELLDVVALSERRSSEGTIAEATVKLLVAGVVIHTAAEGSGPVHALDRALRKALVPAFPDLAEVRLTDYKVRILDADKATAATTRVLVEAARGDVRWSTVGCSPDIVQASVLALADSYELCLLRSGARASGDAAGASA